MEMYTELQRLWYLERKNVQPELWRRVSSQLSKLHTETWRGSFLLILETRLSLSLIRVTCTITMHLSALPPVYVPHSHEQNARIGFGKLQEAVSISSEHLLSS